uniref:Histidine--tRNA ligase n=1 Tax=uncultured marine thaumarchaeote AD1000_19_G07 TaxID=1455897 RepID=A0A075FKH4_9ARCH|nr:histidyl-tRNA synthetase (HARS, hisS) [uncultured marine thaumarchaeote AD1000_19_G07]
MSFRLPRGMRDIEEEEYTRIEKVRSAFNDTCEIFGFKRLMPSPIEMLSTLEAKSGPGIKDEIYHFKDKKDRDLGLRFDLTVGITRHITGKKDLRRPHRVGTFGDMFRYDEPQKGRYRWFHQWNAEIYYTVQDNPRDHVFELFKFTISLFNKIGIDNFKIKVGHREIAESFVNLLIYEKLEKPNEDNQQDVTTILRLLDKIEKKILNK